MADEELDAVEKADPHSRSVFWRLLDYFGLTSHPTSSEEPDDADPRQNERLQRWLASQFKFPIDRRMRYRIYQEMDAFPLVSSVMDAYAEEVTQTDYDRRRTVWIESKHPHMVEVGDVCLKNIKMEDAAFGLMREIYLLGDSFRRPLYETGKGVLGWKYTFAGQVHREEDKYDRLVGYRQDGVSGKFRGQRKSDVSFPWDFIHYRLIGRETGSSYGTSSAMPLFRPWRSLCVKVGSLVWTANGVQAIEAMLPGDSVYCHNPEEKMTFLTTVVAVAAMGVQKIVRVSVGGVAPLFVTERHGLLVLDQAGFFSYKAAGDLIVGQDRLVLPSRHTNAVAYAAVEAVEPDGEAETFDLQVADDLHNFVLGGVVSSNTLLEDSDLMYQLRRGADRNMVLVDIGNMDEVEGLDRLRRFERKLKRDVSIDPASGSYQKNYNPMTPIEDIFMPIRGPEDATRIESVPGNPNQLMPERFQYYVNQYFGAARAIKGYFGWEGEIDARCLIFTTRICCDSGNYTLADLIERFDRGEDLPRVLAYNLETRKPEFSAITRAAVTLRQTGVVDVVLDDGTIVTCTPDHKWHTLTREWVEARDLYVGEELISQEAHPMRSRTVGFVRTRADLMDTGDLTVAGHHNFFVSAASGGGVLVHNSTLAQMDVRFARMLKRGQRAFIYGTRATLDMHFLLYGADKEDAQRWNIYDNPYTVQMPPISYLDEWERLELVQLRYSLIDAMAGLGQALQIDATAWATYVLIHYAKLPEEVVRIMLRKADASAEPPPGAAPVGAGAPAGGNGNGFGGAPTERLRQRRTLLTEAAKKFGRMPNSKRWSSGYYELTEAERTQVATAIHASPALRRIVGDIASYGAEEQQLQQIDPSLLPPMYLSESGEYLTDSVEVDAELEKFQRETDAMRARKTNG